MAKEVFAQQEAVLVDQLPSGFATSTQVDFFKQWGIDDLVREGADYWKSMKHAPDVATIKMHSCCSESISLTDMLGGGVF
jgi:hypothetical protein